MMILRVLTKREIMNKKIASSIVIFIIFFLNIHTTSANSNPYVYIKDVTKYKDSDQAILEIHAENMNGSLVTLGIDVKYDTEKLEFVSSKKGKDLKAEMQLAEDRPNQKRVAIGAIKTSGFEDDGIYYTVTFKVKDSSSDISVDINISEATDAQGNDVKVDAKGGKIKISSEKKNNNEKIEKSPENQKIENFEKNDINELTTLEEIITEDGNIEVLGYVNLVYETEDGSILEVSNDGLMIPNKDGTTNVRIKLNGETLGNVEVSVKSGKVEKISGTDRKLDFEAQAVVGTGRTDNSNYTSSEDKKSYTSQVNGELEVKELENDENIDSNNELYSQSNNKNNINDEEKQENRNIKYIIILVVIVIILVLIFLIIYKKQGGKK